MSKKMKKFLWICLCIVLALGVFGYSSYKKLTSMMGISDVNFALQGEDASKPLTKNEYTTQVTDIKYIKEDGTVDTRPMIVYRPSNVDGDIPMIFIPHYAAEINSKDFVSYIRKGWAVAACNDFKMEYNATLETDDLVWNNAALYTLRHMDGIDPQRIAIVGGSAGGYMSLMLNALQMGTAGSVAVSPISNVYFNFK